VDLQTERPDPSAPESRIIAGQNNLRISISGLPSPLPLPPGSRRGGSVRHPEIDSGCIRDMSPNNPLLRTHPQREPERNTILDRYDPES